MSNWSHLVCLPCWRLLKDMPRPPSLGGAPVQPCCICGKGTDSGIWIHWKPENIKCQGVTGVHQAKGEQT